MLAGNGLYRWCRVSGLSEVDLARVRRDGRLLFKASLARLLAGGLLSVREVGRVYRAFNRAGFFDVGADFLVVDQRTSEVVSARATREEAEREALELNCLLEVGG